MIQKHFISVICPVFNEAGYIDSLVGSILQQDYDREKMEVFLIDGMSTDDTRSKLERYSGQYPFLKVLDNPQKIVPCAMNIGIRESNGDYIIRLDAHSQYPHNYFSKLIEYAEKLNSDNVGGVCITAVKNRNRKTLAIMEVLSNKFGVGDSLFRIGAEGIRKVDTVVFGCFKRNVFDRFGYYDERLVRNQDIELNKRIKRGGGTLYQVSEIRCTYFARETFSGLIKNNYQNGLWNILTIYLTKTTDSLSLRHFIPLLFILSLLVPPVLAIIYFPLILISVISLLLYSILNLSNSLSLSWKRNINAFCLMLSFFFLHFSYGLGSLIGILKLPFVK